MARTAPFALRRSLRQLLGLALVTAVAAGCGGGDDDKVGPAARLIWTTQPTTLVAGGPGGPFLTPAPRVAFADSGGRVVSGAAGQIQIHLFQGATDLGLANRSQVIASGGGASFHYVSWSIPGTYTLVATATGFGSVTSAPFTVVPAPQAVAPGGLAFVDGPPNTVTGTGLTTAVALVDRFGNVIPQAGVEIALDVTGSPVPGVLLAGAPLTATTGSDGRAVFTAAIASVNALPDTQTLTATQGAAGPGQRIATSAPFRITNTSAAAGAAAGSRIVSGSPFPAEATSGVAVALPVVETDSAGTGVAGDTITVSLVSAPTNALTRTTGSFAGTTAAVTAADGVAQLSLSFTVAGTYTLAFGSATPNVKPLTASLSVVPGAPAKLAFLDTGVAGGGTCPHTGQPRSAGLAGNLGAVQVLVEDVNGNVATSPTVPVTMGILGAPPDVTLNGTKADVWSIDGTASFDDLNVTGAGVGASALLQLEATAFSLLPAASAMFRVSLPISDPLAVNDASASSQLRLTTQPETGYGLFGAQVATDDSASVLVDGNSGVEAVTWFRVSPNAPTAAVAVAGGMVTAGLQALTNHQLLGNSGANLGTGFYFIAQSALTGACAVTAPFDAYPFVPQALRFVAAPSPSQTQSGSVIGSTQPDPAGSPATGVSPGAPFLLVYTDTFNGYVTDAEGVQVTASVTGDATLTGTTVVGTVAGHATFDDLVLTATAATPVTVTLEFSAPGANTVTQTIVVTD